jgi:hypothetical protein
MHNVIATIEGLSNYGQSKQYTEEEVPKLKGELNHAYEERTWRNRCHVGKDGFVEIPNMAFYNAMVDAGRYLNMGIKGQGKKTYTDKIRCGIMSPEPLKLDVKAEDVEGIWLHVPPDGVRGGGKRVPKCFPIIRKWGGAVQFVILDDIITEDVFYQHLDCAGKFIGIGFFRPQRNGYFGRFTVKKIQWR